MYTIELKSQPQKFVRDLPKNLQTQVLDKIETLKKDPHRPTVSSFAAIQN